MKTNTIQSFSAKRFLNTVLNEYLVLLGIIIFAVITGIIEPKFLTLSNLSNLMRQFGPLAFVSLGMTFVILGGYIDLSAAGLFSLISVVSLMTANLYGVVPAVLVGLSIGLAIGILNGVLLIAFGVENSAGALFITYGVSILCSAFALIATNGSTKRLDSTVTGLNFLGKGSVGIIPVSFILFLVLLIILYIFQSRTYAGRSVSYLGGNPTAARLAGIRIKKSIITIYAILGITTAVGAIVQFARVTTAGPKAGTGFETNAIMAVVIGGTSLSGGKGSILRTVLGVIVVTLMSNCLNLLGVSAYMQDFIQGLIMILAIWLDNRKGQIGGVSK